MRIVFLCGSFQPGADGVGDYTRRLASKLISRGNQVIVIALYDKEVKTLTAEFQEASEVDLFSIRIPFLFSFQERLASARQFIDDFDPEWVSLQYVPYSFHNKGLPFAIGTLLKKLNKKAKWHIMFHELWVGFSKISSLKHRTIGLFQKNIVKAIIKVLKPEVVATSNRLYQLLLADIGIRSTILPLFSNIEVSPVDNHFKSEIYKELSINENEIGNYLLAGIFGNIHLDARLENSIMKEWLHSEENKKKMVIVGFGKIYNNGLAEFKRLEKLFPSIKFRHLGEQPETKISNIIQLLDIAFCSTTASHIGKSGVFAALKLHGCKVMVPDGETIPEYSRAIEKYNENFMDRPFVHWSVNYVSEKFDELLKSTKLKVIA